MCEVAVCICDTELRVLKNLSHNMKCRLVNSHSEINRVHRIPVIAFANAQHNAHAAQDDAHVAIQMQGPLSLLVIRALRGVLGNILSNRAYWVRMGPARYTQFSTGPIELSQNVKRVEHDFSSPLYLTLS